MGAKERFVDIYREKIKREGSEKLLDFLLSPGSDFFTAPASTRFHGAHEGGLCEHSMNVYDCLTDYLARPRVCSEYGLSCSEETVAVVALLHDICKINCYKPSFRNVKDEKGVWQRVPTYEWDDTLPYGHGEKSVYILSGFMRLSRDEALAIRFHMGFSETEKINLVSDAFHRFPLAFALHTADMEATIFLEKD